MTVRGVSPANPYKPVKPRLRVYTCFELWNMGYEDGFRGRERRKSQSEVERIERERIRALEAENAAMREIVQAVANAGADQNYGSDCTLLILCPGDDAETLRDRARLVLSQSTDAKAS